MSRHTRNPAFALLALTLLPGLTLGRTGILPCPMMADMDAMGMGMMGSMPMSGEGTAMPMAGSALGGHAMPPDGTGSDTHPRLPFGHVPCDCCCGCICSAAAGIMPMEPVSFDPATTWVAVREVREPRTRRPAPVPHLLPFAIGPPPAV